jgi:hypothetical protein
MSRPEPGSILNYVEALGLKEHKCTVCGKKFECKTTYAYRKVNKKGKANIYFCSYSCMRKYEKGGLKCAS